MTKAKMCQTANATSIDNVKVIQKYNMPSAATAAIVVVVCMALFVASCALEHMEWIEQHIVYRTSYEPPSEV
jgi:hypothetical protein